MAQSWISPYIAIFQRYFGQPGRVAAVRMARALKDLDAMDSEACLLRWENYCQATPYRFYSAERFAEVWEAWDELEPEKPAPKKTMKWVEERTGQRMRLVQVPLDDPRPEAK